MPSKIASTNSKLMTRATKTRMRVVSSAPARITRCPRKSLHLTPPCFGHFFAWASLLWGRETGQVLKGVRMIWFGSQSSIFLSVLSGPGMVEVSVLAAKPGADAATRK
eukprot:1096141-Amphidinium_carterae.1